MSVFDTYTQAGAVIAEEKNIVAGAIDVVTAPFTFSSDVLVTQTNRAVSVIAHSVLFGLLGEAYGHKRARSGSQSIVPLFRG